jgi:aminoglycoside 6-adenylyltransferase
MTSVPFVGKQMNKLQQIEAAFTTWAQANDEIRAAFVVGSQARIDHPADEWADLDIIMFARNVERYQDTTDWIEALAPVWIAIVGRTVAGDPERLVLFEGGVQVDFVFVQSVTEHEQMLDLLRNIDGGCGETG